MVEKLQADASPEKWLFISLITRDIPLVAAFLDLIDNSVNSAVEPYADRLKTAKDYQTILADETIGPLVRIDVELSPNSVVVCDKAHGISATTARDHVFKFGRAENEAHLEDRLSVYGIGLKRALFKLGDLITIRSDNVAGGFDLKQKVSEWVKPSPGPWTFPITTRDPVAPAATGTRIEVKTLYVEVKLRLQDGVFKGQLREAISRTYAFYMERFVEIYVDGDKVEPFSFDIGQNHVSETLNLDGVSCAITAGLGIPVNGAYRERTSGWFIFCNGRAVISADKSLLTGWGIPGTGLPSYQPKHRPFTGTVFFVSERADRLPWTTTKAGINEDSVVWQEAKRAMASQGRVVISFLDKRYNDEGTEIASADLQEAAGG
jgi:hypothetical protein